MPRSVGGWRLGSSPEELREHCESAGGVLVMSPAERGTAWHCDEMVGQPAEASGIHCGGSGTCSVYVAGKANGAFVVGFVERWRERFGQPSKSSEQKCEAGSAGQFDLRWQRDGLLWDITFMGVCPDSVTHYSIVLLDQQNLPPASTR